MNHDALLDVMFPSHPPDARRLAAVALNGCSDVETLALFAVCDGPDEIGAVRSLRFPPALQRSLDRWVEYTHGVEMRLRGETNRSSIPCVRCGGHRITVTTKQLRRADEGATELRHCKDCGHTTRCNA